MTEDKPISAAMASRFPVRPTVWVIVMMAILYAIMASLADWHAFVNAIATQPLTLWVQVVVLSLLSYLLRFARWHHFITTLGYHIPLLRHLAIYWAAFSLTLTPGKTGETIRSVYLRPYGVLIPQSIGTFVSERLFDLIAVSLLASFAASLCPQQKTWLITASVCILIVVLSLRSRLLRIIERRAASPSVAGYTTTFVATVRFLLSGQRMIIATPLSLLAWMAQGIALYLIVLTLGYPLSAVTVVAIYCLSILAGAASFIPGGLGATEGAIAYLLTTVGVDHTDAIMASLVSRSLTLWLAIGMGVLAMMRVHCTDRDGPKNDPSGDSECDGALINPKKPTCTAT